MRTPRAARRPARETSSAERLLLALGVDRVFADAVLGDLAEEYAARAARDGAAPARRWYVQEVLRSAPHLAWSAVRRLDPRQRAVLVAGLAGVAVAVSVAVLWRLAGAGPPVRLVAGVRDTVVVNHIRPVSLPTQVLDAAGRTLPDTGVRYTWTSGVAVTMSARGVVTCLRPGDATVRASLGPLATDVVLLCRPVHAVRATIWNDFVLGDPARELPTEFTGVDGEPVTLLSARVSVRDSSVATLDGLRIRPLRPGRTQISVTVGDRSTEAAIRVFAPVHSLEGLRPAQRLDQRRVAAPVHLAHGAAVRWPLPVGLFNLVFLPEPAAAQAGPNAVPLVRVDGPVMCLPEPGPRVYNTECLVRGPGATVTVAHPGLGAPPVAGALAVEWTAER